ncbi:hypothetical protein FIBSPDRAFT_535600 [Athelia psychrophila]|uniref:Uncharacterized protein n=1 Tax=Athelia psychrophila TaxID=1759441 RepID=A0A166J5F4_9AGAM|nr:hypothetical protein FIBSPDRAFT_535600 [Fibularhizoctonia sp. CBS 109695]
MVSSSAQPRIDLRGIVPTSCAYCSSSGLTENATAHCQHSFSLLLSRTDRRSAQAQMDSQSLYLSLAGSCVLRTSFRLSSLPSAQYTSGFSIHPCDLVQCDLAYRRILAAIFRAKPERQDGRHVYQRKRPTRTVCCSEDLSPLRTDSRPK